MEEKRVQDYIKEVIKNLPADWLSLTTHRLDIYNEALAKTEFIEKFERLYLENSFDSAALSELPTAYDYIRLGHPLSCVLEWVIAKTHQLSPKSVMSFSSETIPMMAVLRKNSLEKKNTRILYKGELPAVFDIEMLQNIYGYSFELKKVDNESAVLHFEGSTIFFSQQEAFTKSELNSSIDFYINSYPQLGSVIIINGDKNESYISDIQHVRRRESIAMTPANSLLALRALSAKSSYKSESSGVAENKAQVLATIQEITGTPTTPLVSSSGLSIQYAILMGLVQEALENHKGKAIKIIVPPNCYGGTNDQARRVAACIEMAEVVDLPVDGGNDMVQSIELVLSKIASEDAVPYIIAEIPTNPRVEVPDLLKLKEVLTKERKTSSGEKAIDPVFILDQTFCPNVHFVGARDMLSSVRTISFASGSKFPSGGLCTSGYCVGNKKSEALMEKIQTQLRLCDNEATALQLEILAMQMPSMKERISEAYKNTREFVEFIKTVLPAAKINFVSEELAAQGFTPSVFSLDLPTKGNTAEEKEAYKRELNHKLINLMITQIPDESKYCVSYGQLKGCYWTIPATSTQGTTKEDDKDYIARVALSPEMDLERHKEVFRDFVENL